MGAADPRSHRGRTGTVWIAWSGDDADDPWDENTHSWAGQGIDRRGLPPLDPV